MISRSLETIKETSVSTLAGDVSLISEPAGLGRSERILWIALWSKRNP